MEVISLGVHLRHGHLDRGLCSGGRRGEVTSLRLCGWRQEQRVVLGGQARKARTPSLDGISDCCCFSGLLTWFDVETVVSQLCADEMQRANSMLAWLWWVASFPNPTVWCQGPCLRARGQPCRCAWGPYAAEIAPQAHIAAAHGTAQRTRQHGRFYQTIASSIVPLRSETGARHAAALRWPFCLPSYCGNDQRAGFCVWNGCEMRRHSYPARNCVPPIPWASHAGVCVNHSACRFLFEQSGETQRLVPCDLCCMLLVQGSRYWQVISSMCTIHKC